MKNGFFKSCSVFLVIILLFNMLPHRALASMMSAEEQNLSAGNIVTDTQPNISATEIVGEVISKRTEFAKEFRMSNGLHMAAVYNTAVHYQENGQWKEIDNTLVATVSGTESVYTNKAGVWNIVFPQQLTSEKYVTVTKDGYTLRFGMAGELTDSGTAVMRAGSTYSVRQAQNSAAQIQQADMAALRATAEYPETVADKLNSRLQYSNVYSNTNIVYDLQSNKLKESVVIGHYDSNLRGYRYTLDAGSLVPVLNEDNTIFFYNSNRTDVVMVMPAPFMVDAQGEFNYDVGVVLLGKGSQYTLQYILPQQWMAAEERAWPVVLDPVISADIRSSNVRDMSIGENKTFGYTDGAIQCGYGQTWGRYYTLVKYAQLPDLTASDVIVQANMRLYKAQTSTETDPVEVHKVNGTWESETVTWSNAPDFDETVEDFALVGAQGTYYWDVTNIVRGWYEGENTGMLFKIPKAMEDAQISRMKQFWSSDYSDISTYIPTLQILFRNSIGLEDYWDYTASSAGRAGTGYVNQFTGNLVWVHTDLGFDGMRMPVTINHIYNAADSANNTFGMGYGWRTNFNQRITWQTVGNVTSYIWEDADGTRHYFESESGTYKDEDGLELTLETEGSGDQKTYSITDKSGNKSYFNAAGYLTRLQNNQQLISTIDVTYDSNNRITRVTDGVGRKYDFIYANGLLTQISYKGSRTTEITHVSFTYANGDLTGITYRDQQSVAYAYKDNSHRLTTATDIDGYQLKYTYKEPTGASSWQPYRIATVVEKDGESTGGELSFQYDHNQTTITDAVTSQKQIIQFNNYGNTIAIQDGEGRAQYARYATDKDPENETYDYNNAKGNQLRLSSVLQNTVVNLLPDSNFELTSPAITVTWTGSDAVISRSAAAAYYGTKSMQVVTTGSGSAQTVYAVEVGKAYTFSAYVKTGNSAAYLQLGNGVDKQAVSERVYSNSGWTRLEVSFVADSWTVTAQVVNAEAGTTYVDCVQLEKTPTASRYNLIENGDFWDTTAWSPIDTRNASEVAAPQLFPDVYELYGTYISQNRISQTVKVSGNAGDSFVVAGWAKGNSVPLTVFDNNLDTFRENREFGLQVKFNYTDGTTSEPVSISFNPAVENWQYLCAPVTAKGAFSSITVYLVHDYGANSVFFDGIQLFKERFGNYYTYDGSGNHTKTEDVSGGTTNYTYNAEDEVVSVEQADGTQTGYEYDDYHNLKKMTTATGVVYEYGYNAYGNNTSVKVTDSGVSITSSTHYTEDGNYPAFTVDASNTVTAYDYDLDTGVLNWVENPYGGVNAKTTYTYDNMYRMVSAAASVDDEQLSVEYTYGEGSGDERIGDMLTAVTTGSTIYSFGYGDFSLRDSVRVGKKDISGTVNYRTLATYYYTSRTNMLQRLAYGNGDSVQYTYDDMGRVLTETYENGRVVTYNYNNDGAVATIQDTASGITETYYYDTEDRLVKFVESGSGYSHIIEYTYNIVGNITNVREEINGYPTDTAYLYDLDGRVVSVASGLAHNQYIYDDFGRVFQQITKHNGQTIVTDTFTYETTGNTTSGRVTSLQTATGTYTYTYDAKGNILSVTFGGKTTTYDYDSQNQLIRENNQAGGYTYVWTYDNAGNISSRKRYDYTTAEEIDGNFEPTETLNYDYDNATWGDLLTKVNNLSITYDTVGNPLNYYNGYSFTWENGRRLSSMAVGMSTWTMGYDNSGMRIRRTDGTTDYRYAYNGGKLTQMTVGNVTLDFAYAANGVPLTVTYDSLVYYYVTNLQGDVTAILNHFGIPVVEYTYDAWGNILSTTGSMASTLGQLNPLRYRGYVYDSETGFYYLQSRYYDPAIGRFINADIYVSTGQGLLGNNMFAYCNNNSIVYVDSSGTLPVINDIFNEIKKSVRWTLNNVIDPVVRGTEELLSNTDLTVSPGYTAEGNLLFIGAAIAGSIAIDTRGNVGLQMTVSLNGNNAFSFSGCKGRSNMITNAPSIYHLNGFSAIGGGSLFLPVGPLAVGGGLDINAILQSVGNPFWGVSYMRGLSSVPGFEIHAGGSYTFTLFSFNIFDIYDSVYDVINGR